MNPPWIKIKTMENRKQPKMQKRQNLLAMNMIKNLGGLHGVPIEGIHYNHLF